MIKPRLNRRANHALLQGDFAVANRIIVPVILFAFGISNARAELDPLLFEREIRPLFVSSCNKCHGAKKQEGDLRLDTRGGFLKGGASGPLLAAGNPLQGTLWSLLSHSGEVKMPPSGKLPAKQLESIKQWLLAGAPWPEESSAGAQSRTSAIMPGDKDHWSFRPVSRPAVPKTRNSSWSRAGIDHFLLSRMETAGITPAPIADKRTLIRRASYDLTGLPPTPEEIEAFVADQSPAAFDQLVNRLLASPRYGERWGRHWLDVARYADTAGDGADYPAPEAWRYRNWVVRAFNADMPFDRFVREQIAGDILAAQGQAKDYADCVTATGYLAVGKRYGYSPGPDYQHLDFADVIESVGRGLMGLSLGCARCHDHKYEPVSTADYYSLYGIVQGTSWAFPGGEEYKKPANMVPLVPPAEATRLRQELELRSHGDVARLRDLAVRRAAVSGKVWLGGMDLDWEGQSLGKAPAAPWLSMGPNSIIAEAQSPFVHAYPAGSRGVRMAAGKSNDGIRFVMPEPLKTVAGRHVDFTFDSRIVASATGSYRLYLGRGVIASTATDVSVSASEIAVRDGMGWRVVCKTPPAGTWFTVRLTLDTDKRVCAGIVATQQSVTEFAGLKLHPAWDGVLDTIICDGLGHVAGPCPVHDLDNFGVAEARLPRPGQVVVAAPVPQPDQTKALAAVDAEIKVVRDRMAKSMASVPYPVAYAVSEGKATNARIQKRGEPDKLGPEVPRQFLAILGGDSLPAGHSGSGRLELAQWIARRENPLTARVFVNRVWQWHFGKGLVPTPDDFGLRGERPTHPELLDWLTASFVESGWSVKTLHRLIMNSAAYQVAAVDSPDGVRLDPENKLYWRHDRRVLDAESLRDGMMFASGLLDLKVPEGHPFPPMETWGFTIHNPFHAVYESNHRSLYLMSQRNRRNPYLSLFDAADPNLTTGSRMPTITPSQALFLMNSGFVHEQARGLAERIQKISGDDRARIRYAFALTQGREVTAREIDASLEFMTRYQKAASGTEPAWQALSRTLLVSNAALHVD